ncbi:MAG: tetratricopeptide repeat protein [Candidatus Methanomethylophilaceae archaeon]
MTSSKTHRNVVHTTTDLNPTRPSDQKKAYKLFLETERNIKNDMFLAMMFMNLRKKEAQEDAFRVFETGVEKDIAEAYALVGQCYLDGIGVRPDIGKALEYFEIAADKGVPDAAFCVGNEYMRGRNVEPDYGKALKYFLMASKGGDPRGSNGAGILYLCGKGTEKDFKKAKMFFRKAVAKGHPTAHQNLKIMEESGEDYDYWPEFQAAFARSR